MTDRNQPAKILVVDDEPSIRFFLEEMLSSDGYDVTAVESGEAALEQIATRRFDLAMIDLKMPGIGGLEVMTAIRTESPETATIVLTAHASMDTAIEALRLGAHDYLFKPCKSIELRESVHRGLLKHAQALKNRDLVNALEQGLASSGTIDLETLSAIAPAEAEARFLQRGDLIVDLMRHIITLEGVLLELSPTEFDLLAYLVNESPRVVPPQELVHEVQGYTSQPKDSRELVRYHVYRIRRKIKAATGRADIIRTVRRVGYAIAE